VKAVAVSCLFDASGAVGVTVLALVVVGVDTTSTSNRTIRIFVTVLLASHEVSGLVGGGEGCGHLGLLGSFLVTKTNLLAVDRAVKP
jgi:hypothetical protein